MAKGKGRAAFCKCLRKIETEHGEIREMGKRKKRERERNVA